MKSFVSSMDKLPWLVKLILAIPALDIIWNIYRLMRSCIKNNIFGIILAIILILPGTAFMWLIDIICVICCKKVLWIN